MNRPVRRNRPDFRALAFTAVVFAYCYVIRWLLIVWNPTLVEWTMPPTALDAITYPESLHRALQLTTLFAFGFIGMTLIQLLLPRITRCIAPSPARRIPLHFACFCLLLCVMLYAGVALVLAQFGIGVQGQLPLTVLPFKLAGLLVYLKAAALPTFVLAVVYLMERNGYLFWSRLAAASLVGLGIMDMFLFDTRSSALRAVVLLALLWWVGRLRLRVSDKTMLLAATLALPILIALVTQKRLFGEFTDTALFGLIGEGINFLLFRITGVEHLTVIAHLSPPLSFIDAFEVLTSERGVSGYYTVELLNIDPQAPQTFAPSALGWLYLMGGPLLIFVGGLLMGWAVVGLYALLARPLPVLAPVAKALYIFMLLIILSDGAMESPIMSFVIGYAALIFVETLLLGPRRSASNTSSNKLHDTPAYRFV